MTNKDYWVSRMLNLTLMGERSVIEYETALELAYAQALAEIQKEIQAFYGKYAKENKVSYAEARRRLNAGEVKSFQALLRKWYEAASQLGASESYKKYLQSLGERVYITRLESLEASARNQIELLKAGQYAEMTALLSVNYTAAYYLSQFTLAQGTGVAVAFAEVSKLGVETAVKTRWDKRNYSDSIWADRDKLITNIEKIIPQSFSRGLNSNQLGDMLAKEMNTSKNRGRALARTEVTYITNQADLTTYKSIGVEKYEYLATLDMRTSEICRSLDGFVGTITQAGVGINFPPMHVNCRSTTIPYFEDDDAVERVARDREGRTIKVPRRMTQEEWIKEYVPEDQQEQLLGFVKKFYTAE